MRMKTRKLSPCILVFLLMILLLSSIILSDTVSSEWISVNTNWSPDQLLSRMCFTQDVNQSASSISVQYVTHSPLSINGNNDFKAQAEEENWPGEGTLSAPFLIDGLNITSQMTRPLIDIRNTDVYFQIRKCLLKEGMYGITLVNVMNGYLTSNTIINNEYGIYSSYSENNSMFGNTIANNSRRGVVNYYCRNNNLSSNIVANNIETGIHIYHSGGSILSNNEVINNSEGIELDGLYNILIGNIISHTNGYAGIYLVEGGYGILSGNMIVDNNGDGIMIDTGGNTISGNIIANNSGRGIGVGGYNNKIQANIFQGNYQPYQASDHGSNNVFSHNYWDNWTTPDDNEDGIVDQPYFITGFADNVDPSPSVCPYHLLPGVILNPTGGEIFSGHILLQWTPATDLEGHVITYSVSYSADNGTSWILLTSNLTVRSYVWDSTIVRNGAQYLIRVNASCPQGSWYVTTCGSVFAIENGFPITTAQSIYPSNQSSYPSSQSNSLLKQPKTFITPLVVQILSSVVILFFIATLIIVIKTKKEKVE